MTSFTQQLRHSENRSYCTDQKCGKYAEKCIIKEHKNSHTAQLLANSTSRWMSQREKAVLLFITASWETEEDIRINDR